ncbi:unnamed protein product [Cyclocybe aegerita]|uniref:Zn(2)-C6 fungal-type domain-containing protein n=1 Tax=Cyclocybe aegerita TaxID=1973307 RepID=A0A8S0W8R2_CYCAE|nr:unnamed protein product [Cyclocybe aegerita]
MSSETTSTSRKKRASTDSQPAPEGDHRKRRRNRTTQSCLNCHTSKRMCDRKRPACARCTQLGLTGLCVYEVDDPSQRTDAQDESSRLLKRVAELEGVIRELKNKPHPRWIQPASSGEDFEKWQARLAAGDESCSSSAPSPPNSSPCSERGGSVSGSASHFSPLSRVPNGTFPVHLQANLDSDCKSPYNQNSPLNVSSPILLTPSDEYPLSTIGIADRGSIALSNDYDLASMFLTYPNLMGCNDGNFSSLGEARLNKHCGCLHETTSYNAMLELSLRLRKASDVLAQSPSHHVGRYCALRQRISELDTFTTHVLSDMTSPPGNISDTLHGGFHAMYPSRPPFGSLQSIRPWDAAVSGESSPASLDDSFMTWEPPRRS